MSESPHSSNLLLASLPAEDMAALAPHLRVIELPHETVLFEAGDTIKALYFPHNGMVSIVVDLSSGETIETATIGRDGLVGGSAAIDDDIALNRAIVQIEGMASVVDVGTFRTLVQQSHTLRVTLRATDSLFWHKHSNAQPAMPLIRWRRASRVGCCDVMTYSATRRFRSPRSFSPKCLVSDVPP
jgi:CRP-like cAMP-binding protein